MLLTKDEIISGLRALDDKARSAGLTVEIAIYGGASLALAFDMRQATRDVDAVVKGHRDFVRQAVKGIADARDWPAEWLNVNSDPRCASSSIGNTTGFRDTFPT